MKPAKVVFAVGIATVLSLGSPCAANSDEKMKSLLVYGDDFAFGVNEPEGWHGDTEAAKKYQVNIVFFPEAETSKAADVTIRVRVNTKVDENLAEDLEADMESYKKEVPGVAFGELDVKHPKYATFPKVFSKPGKFFEYVAYLNPGPEYPFSLSVAMSKAKAAATAEELAAYKKVLESLQVIKTAKPPKG